MIAAYEPVVVTIVKRGGRRLPLSHADRVAAVHEFFRMGKSTREVSELLSMSERCVLRLRRESMPAPDRELPPHFGYVTGIDESGAVAMEVFDACADPSSWNPAATEQLPCVLATFMTLDEPSDVRRCLVYDELTS